LFKYPVWRKILGQSIFLPPELLGGSAAGGLQGREVLEKKQFVQVTPAPKFTGRKVGKLLVLEKPEPKIVVPDAPKQQIEEFARLVRTRGQ
jgi:hypothetical protein